MITLTIGALRARAIAHLDQAAAEARMRHITGAPGQAMVYAAKLAQAQAYLAAHALDADAPVPAYVAADVAVQGGTAGAAAQAIIDAAESFHDGAGPAIEQARRGGKLAIQAATTAEAVATALADALEALAAV